MAMKDLPFNCMDLALARRIGQRPHMFRVEWWERAFRILWRWAEDPCPERDYQKRLKLMRRIMLCQQRYEAMRQWRETRWRPAKPKRKRGR